MNEKSIKLLRDPQEDQRSPEEVEKTKVPREIGILPLRNGVFFPLMMMPLQIGRESTLKLIDDHTVGERIVGIFSQKDEKTEHPAPQDIYQIGTAAVILRMAKIPSGQAMIVVQGFKRIRIKRIVQESPYLRAEVEVLHEETETSVEMDALRRTVQELFNKFFTISDQVPNEISTVAQNLEAPGPFADFLVSNMGISIAEKQKVLEFLDVKERLREVNRILNREVEVLELGSKIQSEAKNELDRKGREIFLREQLKAIQKELGHEDRQGAEIRELRKKITKAKLPKDAENTALKELKRLERMHPGEAEYTVARNYLDWLVALPWSITTEDNLDIAKAKAVLDEDHYGLQKVKDRILEYLAVRKLKKDMKGPILCFVGPPGVGKTSLGRSIARAMGRKFFRMSLGGVRDEAEIRGHRRTYIGALPGRIIQGVRKVGSNNPVFMLDEVDKIGTDFRGDPSSALLEVLDPEQNFSFSDHYLEVDFDLSKVMFITTANVLDTIPPPLRDRMEIIELPGYILEEKLNIATGFLIPKQMKENGLKDENITLSRKALISIISDYTREAGVRNLEREVGSVCRKVARKVAEGRKKAAHIKPAGLSRYLGPARFYSEQAERTSASGVATGLAWTPTGGEIMFIEATKMKGKNRLIMTGHLGEVMKESAQAALSFIRSRASELKVRANFFDNTDIHIHVPAGAIPKDGPSAGLAITAALVSLFRGLKVRADLAMTGEITLRGKVLPIGGVKEKVLAAKRAGINEVIIPEKNKNDLEELPKKAKKDMKFHFVNDIAEIFPILFEKKKRGGARKKG